MFDRKYCIADYWQMKELWAINDGIYYHSHYKMLIDGTNF